jgi:hypothetical protein
VGGGHGVFRIGQWAGLRAKPDVIAKRRINSPAGNRNPLPVAALTELSYFITSREHHVQLSEIRYAEPPLQQLCLAADIAPPLQNINCQKTNQGRGGQTEDTSLSESSLFQPLDQRTLGDDKTDEAHKDKTEIR